MMNIVNIWNYLADTKKLIGPSNAIEDQLPSYCTTVEPPEIPDGQEAVFNEDNQQWKVQDIAMPATVEIVTVYGYAPDTLIYVGPADAIADAIPPNSTTVAPDIIADDGYVLIFDVSAQKWSQAENHLGETVYRTSDAQPVYIVNPGPYPENTTTLSPVDVPYPVWSGSEWVTDTAKQNAPIV